jgi:hypothetical protein
MEYIAQDLDLRMAGARDFVGVNSECVALVRAWTHAPQAATWTRGALVQGNRGLARGTAIATFVHGHYEGHAAIYLGETGDGIRVFDQWNGHKPSERTIHYSGKHSFVDSGANYYVVE